MVLVAVDGIVMAAGMLLFLAAVLGAAGVLGGGFDDMFLQLNLGVPGFDYSLEGGESGNALFGVYAQLRWAALACLAVAGMMSLSRGLYRGRRAAGRAALLAALLLAFPPAWDWAAAGAEAAGMWVLNPRYTFDPASPCPASWSVDVVSRMHDSSPYGAGGDASDICAPGFRVSYLVGQAAGHTSAGPEFGGSGILEFVAWSIPRGMSDLFVNVFASVFKAVAAINLVLVGVMAGIMLDVFAGLAIGALPVLACLAMIPGFARVCGAFLSALPGILAAPVLSALVVVVGSPAVASAGSPLEAWAGASAVLLLACILPAAAVPAVSRVAAMSGGVVVSAAVSAAGVTGGAIWGAAAGGARGAGAVRGGLEGLARGHVMSWEGRA